VVSAFARRCRELDHAWSEWHGGHGEFDMAVADTVHHAGYAREDVEVRLGEIADGCQGAALADAWEREVSGNPDADVAPREIVVLAAGGVPGLAVEALVAPLSLGARVQVRPSQRDHTLVPWLRLLERTAPRLRARIEVVDEPRWTRADAAIVYGSDATVELVRSHLPTGHVAAYGAREAVAVVTADTHLSAVADALADDVLTFAQSGCMSPRWLLLPGASVDGVSVAVNNMSAALDSAAARHLTRPFAPDPFELRRAKDAAALGDGREHTLVVGPATLTIVALADPAQLSSWLAQRRHLLQTAVLATSPAPAPHWEALLLDAGCSRVCRPGEAQHPPPTWPHDGIGRFPPLARKRPHVEADAIR
jgi:hypothetical protein